MKYERNPDNPKYLNRMRETPNQTAIARNILPHRRLVVSVDDGQIVNEEADAEAVTVNVVDGLEVARGTDRENATVLNEDATATIAVDGVEQTVELTDGSGSIDITTSKPGGATISVEAVGLADHPAESDSVEIEVISA